MPALSTGTTFVVPSGKVTVAVEPGSAVPATVRVPFGLTVVVAAGASGAVVSV